jgi:hypothetical protein
MHTVLLVALKPLILAVFGVLVWLVAMTLERLIPEGRVKRFLWKPRGASAKRSTPAARASGPPQAPAVKPPELQAYLRASRR